MLTRPWGMTDLRWPHTSPIQACMTLESQPWQRASLARFQTAMVGSSLYFFLLKTFTRLPR